VKSGDFRPGIDALTILFSFPSALSPILDKDPEGREVERSVH
jgi:hypothetical protein